MFDGVQPVARRAVTAVWAEGPTAGKRTRPEFAKAVTVTELPTGLIRHKPALGWQGEELTKMGGGKKRPTGTPQRLVVEGPSGLAKQEPTTRREEKRRTNQLGSKKSNRQSGKNPLRIVE